MDTGDQTGQRLYRLGVARDQGDLRMIMGNGATFTEAESIWVPPGREQEVREASTGILNDVERRLREATWD